MRKNGTAWFGGGDPAADTSPTFSGIADGTWYAIVILDAITSAVTANFGASAFAYSVPSGFQSGFGVPVPTHTIAGIDSYTKLMLHMDGSDEGTTFTDSSLNPLTVNNVALSVHTDTAQVKFGSTSMRGSSIAGGELTIAGPGNEFVFGTSDFTIDFWLYLTALAGTQQHYVGAHIGSSYAFYIGKSNDASFILVNISASSGNPRDIALTKSIGEPSLNTWHHFALVRSGTTFYTFMDGVQQDTWSSSGIIWASPTELEVGSDYWSNNLQGWKDELRISNGIARWTANFTPPTGAYSVDIPSGHLYRVDEMESLIRTTLELPSQAHVSSAVILQAINDAYKDVAVKTFSIEREDSVNTVAGNGLVPFSGHRVTKVIYDTSGQGLVEILPMMAGHTNISGSTPQYWFPWGDKVVIEPTPDAVYPLTLFVSDYPDAELTLTTEYPTSLPDEFHPCIVDFVCYTVCLKLRKWRKASFYYNQYIQNLKKRKQEYMDRKAEKRAIHYIPNNVKYEGGAAWQH